MKLIYLLECFSSREICGVLRINAVQKLQTLSPLLSGAEEEPNLKVHSVSITPLLRATHHKS